MLRKPIRTRSGRHRIDTDVGGTSRFMMRVASRCCTGAESSAPLVKPEEDCRRTFELGTHIGRRLGKAISRYERRHSLGREKPQRQSDVILKEHHSAVEFTDNDTSLEI